MPFGFWVLGNTTLAAQAESPIFLVSNAFRLLGSGEQADAMLDRKDWSFESQMPFGFWVLGNHEGILCGSGCYYLGLKCLSAFGFWGTGCIWIELGQPYQQSQMPFGFWVLGNASNPQVASGVQRSQMPFGFWVLGNETPATATTPATPSLKCLSAFGFWGTAGLGHRCHHRD